MSCRYIQKESRDYPLRQPKNWKVVFPRYMIELPEHVKDVAITYVGIQPRHEENPAKGDHTILKPHVTTAAQKTASTRVEDWIKRGAGSHAPELWEKFYVEAGYDTPDTEVFVMYWSNESDAQSALDDLDLQALYCSLSVADQAAVGFWRESFVVPKFRLETVYSGNDYRPGIGSLEGAVQVAHAFTGYWGAARDRLPASAHDAFQLDHQPARVDFEKDTKGRVVRGSNEDSVLHIRSGQYWERCKDDEKEGYEKDLEAVLRKGMAHLEGNPPETGDFGLRFMRNLKTNRLIEAEEADQVCDGSRPDYAKSDRRRLETCSAGFFRSLKDLEFWAAKHPTHHKIFHGAHAHATKYGKQTFKMRTWHEVSILKPGEVSFEYINCHPRTGLLPFVDI